ncbi:hypothetical protein [Bradyrhizobium ottawaense]|uniref:hypothetical protein n=1 Tax=Bradyrhizobium ottawaense TaxID=931866 RepID=UPI001BA89713|nr:hypothetical protein [Bradyrhizobium ottawaense]MBR1328823.1 hypothetical protein [Bradyrhizobium ottawaense]
MTIIPANPGFELLCGSIEGGKVAIYAPRPILAWRITEHAPVPIALDVSIVGREMTSSDYISMAGPDGVPPSLRYAVRHDGVIYDASIGGEFDSEEQWREWLLTQAEIRWKRLGGALSE